MNFAEFSDSWQNSKIVWLSRNVASGSVTKYIFTTIPWKVSFATDFTEQIITNK